MSADYSGHIDRGIRVWQIGHGNARDRCFFGHTAGNFATNPLTRRNVPWLSFFVSPYKEPIVGCFRWLPIKYRVAFRFRRIIMLRWALIFLVVALIAAVLGFSGIAAISVEIARLLFLVFIILFVVAVAVHAFQGKKPPL
jgi:uncharacterized membrane protein YtjA (UPF0391 family)